MDINFQDRIDEYLLHPDRLSEEEKSQFLSELEADPQKRAQFELTRDVRLAVTSRARKMSRMEEMRTMYGHCPFACGDELPERGGRPSGCAATQAVGVVVGYCCSRSAGILRDQTCARLFFVRRWIAWRWSSLRRYAVRRSQLRPARRHVVG